MLWEDVLKRFQDQHPLPSTLEGLKVALPPEIWFSFQTWSAAQLAAWLVAGARKLRWDRFRKAKRAPQKPKKKPAYDGRPQACRP